MRRTFCRMKPQDTLDFHLRWGWSKLSRLYAVEAERRGIPVSYVFALMQVDRKGTPSTQLGPRMGMEATSLSRTLKGMEDMGLVERRPDAADGRKALVFLTPDGVAARRQARDLVKAVNARIRELLGDEEVDALIANLRKLNELFDRPEQLLGGDIPQSPLAS